MKKVAVVTGGYSEETQVAVKSAETVMSNLDPTKYDCTLVHIDKTGWWASVDGERKSVSKHDFTLPQGDGRLVFDMAFIVIHGPPGEDGKLQAYFDMINLPYSTAGHVASTLAFNKFTCNTFLKQCGIDSAPSVAVYKGRSYDSNAIIETTGLPCFVKPSDGGSSFGISKVSQAEEIDRAISHAFEHGSEVIVEGFLDGVEVTCGIIERNGELTALPLTEIVSENEFFDFEAKYLGQSQEITPARVSDSLTQKVQEIAKNVFRTMNLRHLARIDFIVVGDRPYMIEANTIPGLSAESLIPQMAASANLPLSELFGGMVENVLATNA